MAHIDELEFFESMFLDAKTAQKQSFRDKCYALRNFLDDCKFGQAKECNEYTKHAFLMDNGKRIYFENVKSDIYEALKQYGFNAGLLGTKYMVQATLLKSADTSLGMMEIYKRCAELFGVSAKSVENTCRYACNNASNLDKSLCTYYENVTPFDVVSKLAEDFSQRLEISDFAIM